MRPLAWFVLMLAAFVGLCLSETPRSLFQMGLATFALFAAWLYRSMLWALEYDE